MISRDIEVSSAISTANHTAQQIDEQNESLFVPLWQGPSYYRVLEHIQYYFRPKTYFEIGVHSGRSLELAKCPAIGIDPANNLAPNFLLNNPLSQIFSVTSDQFFKDHNANAILGGAIDLAFLDGMHLSEFLLRDFANTEPLTSQESVIVLHDCLPTDVGMTRRQKGSSWHGPTRNASAWTGDVWKVLALLRSRRPDLRYKCIGAAPTGLVLITNLDPMNTYLKDNYGSLVKEMEKMTLESNGLTNFIKSQTAIQTTEFLKISNSSKWFES